MTPPNPNKLQMLEQRVRELEKIEADYLDLRLLVDQLQLREQATIDFQNKLKILNEVSIELDRTESFDELCRLGIELGMDRLGFDRLSLWFVDEKREWMLGTFGVDEQGRIRDERGESFKFAGEIMFGFYHGTKQVVVNTEAELLDSQSQVIGHGWHIAVPLLDGREFVGLMTTDNLINRNPIEPYHPELLQLYGSTIGYLAKSKIVQAKVQKFLQAIEHSSSSIALLNADGIIEYVNSSFERLLDYSHDEILGVSLEYLIQKLGSSGSYQTIWQVLLKDGIWRGEWQTLNKSGSVLNILVSISAVKDNDDVTTHYVMVQEDITIHKQIEKQRNILQLERERIHLLETFITNVAHEFKTPLSIINTKTFLLTHLLDNDKALPHIEQIKTQSFQINSMIDDMLIMVRLESNVQLQTEDINLNRLIQDCIHSVKDEMLKKQIMFKSQVSFDMSIKADFERIKLVFVNLIDNAIQYSDEDGEITVQLMVSDNQVQIEIIDNGIGIATDELENIFEPLYRIDKARTTRGTGLGLTIARKVIQAHQGEITVKSQIDQGTKVIVSLPLS